MDQIHHIRQLYYEQDKNISEITQETGASWKTVRKYVDMTDFNLTEPVPASERQFCPKLDSYKPMIDQWLMDDKKGPRNNVIPQSVSLIAYSRKRRILTVPTVW